MEEIRKATKEDKESIVKLVRETMSEVYPNYYPTGAVELFLSYQTKDNIIRDIQNGIVYVLEIDGLMIGTGTIKENRVTMVGGSIASERANKNIAYPDG